MAARRSATTVSAAAAQTAAPATSTGADLWLAAAAGSSVGAWRAMKPVSSSAGGEGGMAGDGAQQAEIGRARRPPRIRASAAASALTAAGRSSPQTISLAIIGS